MKMYIKNGVLTVTGLSLIGFTIFKLNKEIFNDIGYNNKREKSERKTILSWEDETVRNNRHYKTLTIKK